MFLDAHDASLTPSIAFDGEWEPDITKFLWRTVQPGMVIVEIGSNIGYHTIHMANKVGEKGHIYALEPNPSTYEILVKNLDANGLLHRTTILNKGVFNKNARIVLRTSPVRRAHATLVRPTWTSYSSNGVEVEVVDAQELFEQIGRIDLIRMDAEGSEQHIIKCAETYLRKANSLQVVLEFAPPYLEDPIGLLSTIRSLGFRIFQIRKGGKAKEVQSLAKAAHETYDLYLKKPR
jgi:FkbM family methyltransferase